MTFFLRLIIFGIFPMKDCIRLQESQWIQYGYRLPHNNCLRFQWNTTTLYTVNTCLKLVFLSFFFLHHSMKSNRTCPFTSISCFERESIIFISIAKVDALKRANSGESNWVQITITQWHCFWYTVKTKRQAKVFENTQLSKLGPKMQFAYVWCPWLSSLDIDQGQDG